MCPSQQISRCQCRDTAPIDLILAVCLAGPLAALPPSDESQAMVVFGRSITGQEAVGAISAVEGRSSRQILLDDLDDRCAGG